MTPGQIIFIGLIFCFAFGLRSIFGFGGTIFALTILAFFFNIKDMVVLGVFAGMIASLFITLSDLKSFNSKIYFKIMIFTIPGLVLGTMFLKNFSSKLILYIFGILLITYSIWTIWSPQFIINKFFKPVLNFVGGIFSGTFGTPGPFFIAAMRETFGGKSQMRTTLSATFLTLDILRAPIYYSNGIFNLETIAPFWWVVFPLFLTIWLGYKIHIKMPEKAFQIGVSILLGIAGISFLFK